MIFKLAWTLTVKLLWWMGENLTNQKSTLVQVMAWCRLAPSHYLGQCCLRSMSPYPVMLQVWVLCHFWVLGPITLNIFKHVCTAGSHWNFIKTLKRAHCWKQLSTTLHMASVNHNVLTHLSLVSHICITKNSCHSSSDAYMHRKSLICPRGRTAKYTCCTKPRWFKVRSLIMNSFEDQIPVDFIYKYPISKWVRMTWLNDWVPFY